MTENPYARPAPVSPSEERTMGMLAHAIPLGGDGGERRHPGLRRLAVLYLIYKDRGPFVRENAANSLNLQITTGIVLLVSIPLMLILVGFLTFAAAIVRGLRPAPDRRAQGQPRRVVAAADDAASGALTAVAESSHDDSATFTDRDASTRPFGVRRSGSDEPLGTGSNVRPATG